MAITANQTPQQLHIMVFPMMLPGHMIPMIDVARLLARCDGVIVTVLTTPVNAKRFRPMLHRERQCGFKIREHELRFPCVEAGLPEGCENADLIPKGQNLAVNFMVAVGMLRPQVEQVLKQSKPPPSCIVSDMLLTWMAEVAAELNIPRLVFNGSCCFSDICAAKISDSKILGRVNSESEQFTVPELAHNVRLCKAQVKGCTIDPNVLDENDDPRNHMAIKVKQTAKSAYGVIVNSFDELEPDYVKEYQKMHQGRVWCIGPVSLCNQDYQDQALRGANNNSNTGDQQDCLKWLDLQAAGSVVYVSLGSMAALSPRQMAELALGLESSKRPFLWVLGKRGNNVDAFEDWNVSKGFEERNKGRGMIVRGWAPQVLILSHASVRGFLTHCGWNSTLEAICAGVPMVTWPLIAEQFLNEKLVVEVLEIGVSLGLKVSVDWDGEDKDDVAMVKSEEIKEAIDKVMDEGGIKIRMKVRELGEMAKKAVQKGGSSQLNLISLIQNVSSLGTAQP